MEVLGNYDSVDGGNRSFWNSTLGNGFCRANSLNTNETRSFTENVTIATVIFLLVFVAIVGNLAVITLALIDRDLRRQVSNIILGNLAVVDTATAIFVMIPSGIAVLADRWPFADIFCDLHGGFSYLVVAATQYSICLLSLDRVISVRRPLHYPSLVTHRRTFLALIPIWLLSVTFAVRPVMDKWIVYDYWEISCNNNWFQLANDGWVNTAFAAAFVTPCALILGANVYVVSVAHYSSNVSFTPKISNGRKKKKVATVPDAPEEEVSGRLRRSLTIKRQVRINKAASPTTKRILYSILTVTVCFFICLTPYTVIKLIKLWTKDPNIIPNQVNVFSSILHFVNSCINPFIYGILRRDYRRAFYRLRQKFN